MATPIERVRAQADSLGIPYHHRAGVAKIEESIKVHLEANPTTSGEVAETAPDSANIPQPPPYEEPMSQAVYDAQQRAISKRTVGRLKRVRLQNMNPSKKEWPGELISVGSAKLGTFKKYIPFDGKPYHIPEIIYNVLKEKQCTVFSTVKDDRGTDRRQGRLVNEYAIEDLTPLTPEELADLARRQALAGAGL